MPDHAPSVNPMLRPGAGHSQRIALGHAPAVSAAAAPFVSRAPHAADRQPLWLQVRQRPQQQQLASHSAVSFPPHATRARLLPSAADTSSRGLGGSHAPDASAATLHGLQEFAAPAGGQSDVLVAALGIPGLADAAPRSRSSFPARSTRRQVQGRSPGKAGMAVTAPAARAALPAAHGTTPQSVAVVATGTAPRGPSTDAAARHPQQRQGFAPAQVHAGAGSRPRRGVGAISSQPTL